MKTLFPSSLEHLGIPAVRDPDLPDDSLERKIDFDLLCFCSQSKPAVTDAVAVDPRLISEQGLDLIRLSQNMPDIGHRADAFVDPGERRRTDGGAFLTGTSGGQPDEDDQNHHQEEGPARGRPPQLHGMVKTSEGHESSFRRKVQGHPQMGETDRNYSISPREKIKNQGCHGHFDRRPCDAGLFFVRLAS